MNDHLVPVVLAANQIYALSRDGVPVEELRVGMQSGMIQCYDAPALTGIALMTKSGHCNKRPAVPTHAAAAQQFASWESAAPSLHLAQALDAVGGAQGVVLSGGAPHLPGLCPAEHRADVEGGKIRDVVAVQVREKHLHILETGRVNIYSEGLQQVEPSMALHTATAMPRRHTCVAWPFRCLRGPISVRIMVGPQVGWKGR